jgi:LemA protein
VRQYNTTVRSFPSNLTAMVFGHDAKPTFAPENEADITTPPSVDFDRPDTANGA